MKKVHPSRIVRPGWQKRVVAGWSASPTGIGVTAHIVVALVTHVHKTVVS